MIRRLAFAPLAVALLGCGPDKDPTLASNPYRVSIRRTSFGIPHVTADDLASLAYGVGYAAAQDYGCYLGDQIVKVRSERAATFGPGDKDANVDSDFAYLNLDVMKHAEEELPKQPQEARDLIHGYVAGYNRWLADTGVDDLPAPCKGAAWMKPIQDVDLAAYTLDLALRGSAVAILQYLGNATPPAADWHPPPEPPRPGFDLRHPGFGSNGWGIGRDRSANGDGIVLANPHFQWEGEIHWHETHLTIPGDLDVYGVSILGSPTVQIGFNQHVAWTHTVTPSQHFTAYRLKLQKGDPTTYLVDGQPHKMTSRPFTIDVKQSDGSTKALARTMWKTDFGVMANGPALSWGTDAAYALRDANEDDIRLVEQWLRIDRAGSVGELQKALEDVHADPWVYTIAADDKGDALLIDPSRVPNLSPAATAAYQKALKSDALTIVLAQNGATLLDGSTSRDAWIPSDEPYADGLVPVASAPRLARQDFVMNANDAPWATNPAAQVTGYSFLYGSTRAPLIPRTRMNLELLTEVKADGASGADGKFTAEEVEQAIFDDREIVAEQLKDQVVARCKGAAPVMVDGATVDTKDACDALAAWTGRADLDAPGAVLWRELLGQVKFKDVQDAGALYADAFDPNQPIMTPKNLVAKPMTGDDPVLVLLARAKLSLQKAGFHVGSTLRDAQFTKKGATKIPIPGGQDLEGAANVVSYYGKGNLDTSLLPEPAPAPTVNAATSLTTEGYLCDKGSSFVMVAEMTGDGPRVRALLTTSESRDPASKHYEDQTLLFEQKAFRDVLYTEDSITQDPELTTLTLTADR